MVVSVLLGTLKDVVGYIFTSDRWRNNFLSILKSQVVICSPGVAQKLLQMEFVNLPLANTLPKGSSFLSGVTGQHRCC